MPSAVPRHEPPAQLPPPPQDGPPSRPGRRAFGPTGLTVVCGASLFITSLDSTAVNVALPALRAQLSAGPSQLAWIVDAYTLTLAVLLLLAGALGDRLGRRAMFRAGLLVFGLGSLGCALAGSADQLIAVRVLQGVGAALLGPNALSTVTTAIEDPVRRTRAIGLWAAIFGLAAAVGPLVGGSLVDALGWRWIFLVNLPVVALTLAASVRVPETRGSRVRPLDPLGLALGAVAVFGATELLIHGAHQGFGGATPLVCAVLALTGGAAFVAVERRCPHPVFPLALLRRPTFTAATVSAVLVFAILAGFLFVSSVYWQQQRHASALETGLALLPATLALAVVSPLSGRLLHVVGARRLLVGAGLLLALGAGLLALAAGGDAYPPYAAGYLVLGLGLGLVNPPITNTAVTGLPPQQAGVASALATTSRQLGNTLGVAVLAPVAAGPHVDQRRAWLIALGLGLAVAVLNALAGRRCRAEQARRAAPAAPADPAAPATPATPADPTGPTNPADPTDPTDPTGPQQPAAGARQPERAPAR
ncbi:MFS transporter [Kitasatospora sp. NPDC093550]|uniref:MFS transporter n=1 Tax=Kitasatospora sp. NPDC093550 TaxID=3364089 RepID=UPI0038241957